MHVRLKGVTVGRTDGRARVNIVFIDGRDVVMYVIRRFEIFDDISGTCDQ